MKTLLALLCSLFFIQAAAATICLLTVSYDTNAGVNFSKDVGLAYNCGGGNKEDLITIEQDDLIYRKGQGLININQATSFALNKFLILNPDYKLVGSCVESFDQSTTGKTRSRNCYFQKN